MSAMEQIEKTVLSLPVEQRAILAETLLASLPPLDETWTAEEEMAEVERREREIESGATQPVADTEFWRRIESNRKR